MRRRIRDGSGDERRRIRLLRRRIRLLRIQAIQHYLVQSLLARQGQKSGTFGQKEPAFGQKVLPWFPCIPVYPVYSVVSVYSVYSRVRCTFGVSLLLLAKERVYELFWPKVVPPFGQKSFLLLAKSSLFHHEKEPAFGLRKSRLLARKEPAFGLRKSRLLARKEPALALRALLANGPTGLVIQ